MLMSRGPVMSHQPIGKRIRSVVGCCLLVVAALSPIMIQAADKPANSRTGTAATHQSQPFDLSVVGPDGKAVPEITVEVRGEPPVKAEQIRAGRVLRQGTNGLFVTSTAHGRLALALPANPTRFEVLIATRGYAPYRAAWNSEDNPDPVPPAFTAELGAAWSVGGVVVDGQGKPVEGAKIAVRIRYKHRTGGFERDDFDGRVTTDAAGHWRFDSVPAYLDHVAVRIDHADFAPQARLATRWEFGLDRGRDPSASIVLEPGLTVTGTVTDESGKPIAGAVVRTFLHNTIRQAVTGPDGSYRLRSCGRAQARIVVSAKGRALDMQEVHVAPGMDAVNFQMKPAGRVRVRVVDEHGKPIPRFDLVFQRWLGKVAPLEFDEINHTADDRGVWEWRDATLDVLAADIICPGHEMLSKQLVARADEYVFRAATALSVSGRVVDRETKQPVTRFLVGSGLRDQDLTDSFTAVTADGHYRLQTAHSDQNRAYFIRIEADGYEPAVLRTVRGYEGHVTFDFQLTRAQDFDATVLTPEGRPADHATVARSDGRQLINLTNGEVDGPWCNCRETDASGRLHLPPQVPDFFVCITHASGYATYHPRSKSKHRIIVLDPWTRVEGTYRVGGKPLAGVVVSLLRHDQSTPDGEEPRVVETQYTTTGPNGRFVFERAMAGYAMIARYFIGNTDNSISSTSGLPARLPIGRAVHVEIEENGRPVIGSLRPPAGLKQTVDWQSAVVELALQTNWDLPRSHFRAAVRADGSFRTDPLPGGTYALDVHFLTGGPGHVWDRPVIVNTRDNGESVPKPLDLGVLTLEKD
jgi:Carboxypeptidase regulatory-like domain